MITSKKEILNDAPLPECDCDATPKNVWEIHDGRCEWKKALIRKVRFLEPCTCECHGFMGCLKP